MYQIIQKRLAEAIKTSGLKKSEIAKRLHLSYSLISQYSSGKKAPRIETLAELCKLLDVEPNYILGFSDY